MTQELYKTADICKSFEKVGAPTTFETGKPIIARLDGRNFSAYTRRMTRPFDDAFTKLMRDTTKYLFTQYSPDVAYTQSDEITLIWKNDANPTKMLFGARSAKLISLTAADASAFFVRNEPAQFALVASGYLPTFDCRMWQVPNEEEAARVIKWRQEDAMRNSKQMVGRNYFSHRELMYVSTNRIVERLANEKNVIWDDFPTANKSGSAYVRRVCEHKFTPDEITNLPEKHEAHSGKTTVIRTRIEELNTNFETFSCAELASELFVARGK